LTRAPTEEGDAVTLADHGAHAFQALETVAPCAIVLTGACRSWCPDIFSGEFHAKPVWPEG
jgi:hypothetical protein